MLDLDNQKIFKSPDGQTDESEMDIRSRFLLYRPEDNSIYGNYKISGKWYCSDNAEIRKKNIRILPVIRATEMRYIMAECYARKNQFAEADESLNEIRQKRSETAQDVYKRQVLKRTEAVWMNGCRSRKATGIFMNVF